MLSHLNWKEQWYQMSFQQATAVITIVFDAPAVKKEAVTSGLLLIALARTISNLYKSFC